MVVIVSEGIAFARKFANVEYSLAIGNYIYYVCVLKINIFIMTSRSHIFVLMCVLLAGGCVSQNTIRLKTDVLVIGGTGSGTAAGIAAAREGVSALIVEPTPMLGGMFTAQGVGASDGNHNLHSGIWNEFRGHLRSHYGGAEAVHTGWVSATLFEPHVGDSLLKAMVAAEPRLDVRYGYRLTDVTRRGDKVTGAGFVDADGNCLRVAAKIVIDATDLGEALPLSGTAYRVGMDARADTGEVLAPEHAINKVQDPTIVAILKDFGEGADMTIDRPAGYDPAEFDGCCGAHEDRTGMTPQRMLDYGRMPGGKYMINWPGSGNDIELNVVELPYEERIATLEAARHKTLRFVYYIQTELGFRNLGIADDEFNTPDGLAYLPYHREGRRLDGVVRLTLDDVADRYNRPAPLYRTGISVGDYPVDHHHTNWPAETGRIVFPPIPSFSVPLGALIPAETRNLIVADKAISVSNLINGSTRLQPVVMLTGQAAGTLAALSVQCGCTPGDVTVRDLQRALLAQKAYITPLYDVGPEDPDFAILQRIAATGILCMTGEPYYWANRSWFYPERTISVAEFTRRLNEYAPQIAVEENPAPLTAAQAVNLLQRAGSKPFAVREEDRGKPVTRRELAIMLDDNLDPFSRPIDHNGNYIK